MEGEDEEQQNDNEKEKVVRIANLVYISTIVNIT